MSVRLQFLLARLTFGLALAGLTAATWLAVRWCGNPPTPAGIPHLARTSDRVYASGPTVQQVIAELNQRGPAWYSPPDVAEEAPDYRGPVQQMVPVRSTTDPAVRRAVPDGGEE